MSYRLSNSPVSQSRSIYGEKEIKSKLLFFVEGAKTEIIYLQALRKNMPSEKNIDIEIFDRWKNLSGESNQLNIVRMVKKYLDNCGSLGKRKRALIEKSIEKLELNEWTIDEMINLLNNLKRVIGEEILSSKDFLKSQLQSIKTCIDFNPEKDRVCFVLDRDYHSFQECQYDEVLQICEENGFELGITSPNFEFFLLLHISSMEEFEESIIYENKDGFTEAQMKLQMKEKFNENYKKEKYNAEVIISNFNTFKENIQRYSTNTKDLKDKIGSSLGSIVEYILES